MTLVPNIPWHWPYAPPVMPPSTVPPHLASSRAGLVAFYVKPNHSLATVSEKYLSANRSIFLQTEPYSLLHSNPSKTFAQQACYHIFTGFIYKHSL